MNQLFGPIRKYIERQATPFFELDRAWPATLATCPRA
jgi:hypothetical protein